MPLYEYECEAGHRFELIRKFSDPPLEKCPTCGAAVHKLISSPAFQFKGTGWYITDYAKKDGVSASSGDGKTESSDEGREQERKGRQGRGKKREGRQDRSDREERDQATETKSTSSESSSTTPSTPAKSGS